MDKLISELYVIQVILILSELYIIQEMFILSELYIIQVILIYIYILFSDNYK